IDNRKEEYGEGAEERGSEKGGSIPVVDPTAYLAGSNYSKKWGPLLGYRLLYQVSKDTCWAFENLLNLGIAATWRSLILWCGEPCW
ncbi:hypothetical protein Dimus_011388, partial [Dionaea muscipula]